MPLNSPESVQEYDFGPGVAPALPSAPQEKRKAAPDVRASVLCRALDELVISYAATAATLGLPMPVTYGRSSGDSSPTASLQSSMASRLQAKTDVHGSPEYALRWKSWDMLLGPPIIALRASERRISDKGFGGAPRWWPTPVANDELGSTHCYGPRKLGETERTRFLKLPGAALTAGWPTPKAKDGQEWSPNSPPDSASGHGLGAKAQMAGWPTPMAGSPETENYNAAGDTMSLRKTKLLVGWPTPNCPRANGSDETAGKDYDTLNQKCLAKVAGWATPTSRDHKDGGGSLMNVPINGLLGRQTSLCSVQTEKRGALNPEHSLWLLGYPAEWGSCGARAMQSVRKQPRVSSKRTKILDVEF